MPDEAKNGNGNGVARAIERWRLITPSLITLIGTITIVMLTNMDGKLQDIDAKLFTHLTNDEIHIPRDQVVTKGVFEMHCQFAEENKQQYLEALKETEQDLKEYLDFILQDRD